MKQIQLTRGQVAIVCDCHAHLVEGHKWYAHWMPSVNSFYAARKASLLERLNGAPSRILMHAVINSTPKGLDTDHADNDTLNNRCENLRDATRSQNMQNQGKHSNNTSGYKGVAWNRHNRKWQAFIKINWKQKHLGYFITAEAAARAYDLKSIELFGEFANTNFPKEQYK